MKADDYIHLILSVLKRYALAIADYEVDFDLRETGEIHVQGRVTFKDGSYLDFEEWVAIGARGEFVKSNYRYQFVAEGKPVFRYDPAPHHPQVPTFPHHKHITGKRKPEAAQPPTLNQVLMEIIYEAQAQEQAR